MVYLGLFHVHFHMFYQRKEISRIRTRIVYLKFFLPKTVSENSNFSKNSWPPNGHPNESLSQFFASSSSSPRISFCHIAVGEHCRSPDWSTSKEKSLKNFWWKIAE